MMIKYNYVARCKCGAYTVTIGGLAYSMSRNTFNEKFGRLPRKKHSKRIEGVHNCNYCVNKWGIDLCGCGSGEKFGKCRNMLGCAKRPPMQSIEDERICWRESGSWT